MWKKDEEKPVEERAPEGQRRTRSRPMETSSNPATIGPSITITGDVKGEEDLVIQGRVDGSIDLKNQAVTVGRQGRVKAAIVGRVVTVEGEVEGDLTADEQVILRSEAHVQGDITAPRVVLEDGANFRGMVDMTNPSAGEDRSGRSSSGTGGRARGGSKPSGESTRSKVSETTSTPGSSSGESGGGSSEKSDEKEKAAT